MNEQQSALEGVLDHFGPRKAVKAEPLARRPYDLEIVPELSDLVDLFGSPIRVVVGGGCIQAHEVIAAVFVWGYNRAIWCGQRHTERLLGTDYPNPGAFVKYRRV